MRTIFCCFTLALSLVVAAAEDGKSIGKTHDYDVDKLPKLIKVKAGDTIAVNFTFKPENIDSARVKSDNNDVTVKTQSNKGNGNSQIVIHSDKQTQAKMGWLIELDDGRSIAHSGLEVVFE